MNTKFIGVTYGCCDTSGPDDAFGGNASNVQAVTTHQFSFDQCNAGAQSGRTGGGYQASGSASDHDEVIGLVGGGVGPLGWMDVGFQFLVVLVVWRELDNFV